MRGVLLVANLYTRPIRTQTIPIPTPASSAEIQCPRVRITTMNPPASAPCQPSVSGRFVCKPFMRTQLRMVRKRWRDDARVLEIA